MQSLTAEAKRKLAELKRETQEVLDLHSDKVSENTALSSENERLHSENVNRSLRAEQLDKDIESKRIELANLDTEYQQKRTGTGEMEDRVDGLKRTVKDLKEEEARVIGRVAALKVSEIQAAEAVSGRQSMVRELDEEISSQVSRNIDLQNEEKILSKSLATLENRQARVQVAIDDAVKKFRVFEKRIAQFSKETGFLLSYDNPEDLPEDNE